jgi:SAM-dependent methyltransferase
MSFLTKFCLFLLLFIEISCNQGSFTKTSDWDYYPKLGGYKDLKWYRYNWKMYGNKMNIDYANKAFQKIYQFKENEKVASVGANLGMREIIYSLESPPILFYLEDLSPKNLNDSILKDLIGKFETVSKKKSNATFKIVIGDSVKTNLPANYFDKILIENSLHEFSDANKMLLDIEQKLNDGGILFIAEPIAKKPNELHQGCKKRMFQGEELVQLLQKYHFELLEKTQPHKRNKSFFVFKFRKNP